MADQPLPALSSLAAARLAHATPAPRAGELWRVRWDDHAGVVLLLEVHDSHLEVAPVSLDDDANETARRASADASTLGFPVAVWTTDTVTIPVRVLDYQLGTLHVPPDDLPRGSSSWGPTDPRELVRARAQDLLDALTLARWVPDTSTGIANLSEAAANADPRALIDLLGVPRARSLRDGILQLKQGEATPLANILGLAPDDLEAATSSPLPDDLVVAMDQPAVRTRVGDLAERRGTSEVAAWREVAQGAFNSPPGSTAGWVPHGKAASRPTSMPPCAPPVPTRGPPPVRRSHDRQSPTCDATPRRCARSGIRDGQCRLRAVR